MKLTPEQIDDISVDLSHGTFGDPCNDEAGIVINQLLSHIESQDERIRELEGKLYPKCTCVRCGGIDESWYSKEGNDNE